VETSEFLRIDDYTLELLTARNFSTGSQTLEVPRHDMSLLCQGPGLEDVLAVHDRILSRDETVIASTTVYLPELRLKGCFRVGFFNELNFLGPIVQLPSHGRENEVKPRKVEGVSVF
jgi:hypothetical protein